MKHLFGRIASKYDRMNRIMSLALDRRWRKAALSHLPTLSQQPSTLRALDLACGTGDFAATLLDICPCADITCVDLTPEMLDIAHKKLTPPVPRTPQPSTLNYQQPTFLVGDAQNLAGIGDGSFDLAMCAFGFRNFPDKRKALAECRRLLKPGGSLVVLELFCPKSRLLGGIVRLWLAAIAAIFAGGSRKEYAYLRSSIANTVTADKFVQMAKDAGFAEVRKRSLFPAATALTFS